MNYSMTSSQKKSKLQVSHCSISSNIINYSKPLSQEQDETRFQLKCADSSVINSCCHVHLKLTHRCQMIDNEVGDEFPFCNLLAASTLSDLSGLSVSNFSLSQLYFAAQYYYSLLAGVLFVVCCTLQQHSCIMQFIDQVSCPGISAVMV